MRCVIYSRVSTSTNQTVANQILELREIANRKGYTIVNEFSDVMSGAKSRSERKGFDALIKGAVRKDFDMILVWSVDRLGRSLQDLISFLNEINSVNCNLYIHQSGLDTSTPSGRMMFSMIGVFAEFERGMIRERVISGQKRAVSEGKHIGRPTRLNDKIKLKIQSMKEEGISNTKIARQLKIGVGTIYKVLQPCNV